MTIFKKEPAVILGGLISLLMYIQEELQTFPGEGLTWKTLAGLVAGILIRFVVVSPATAERIRENRATQVEVPGA